MGETTRVTEKRQTTSPKTMREKYDFEPDEEVRWEDTDEGILLRKSVGRVTEACSSRRKRPTPTERRLQKHWSNGSSTTRNRSSGSKTRNYPLTT